jgi:hypothetical protein
LAESAGAARARCSRLRNSELPLREGCTEDLAGSSPGLGRCGFCRREPGEAPGETRGNRDIASFDRTPACRNAGTGALPCFIPCLYPRCRRRVCQFSGARMVTGGRARRLSSKPRSGLKVSSAPRKPCKSRSCNSARSTKARGVASEGITISPSYGSGQ